MLIRCLAFAALLFAAAPCAAATHAPVQVMVFGATHFANQNLDVHNVTVDDVLTPRRQAEVQALTDALARFKPTKICVEYESDRSDLSLAAYETFTPAELATNRREQAQIGYRLARQLHLPAVYGVDEKAHEGGYDYFPMGAVMAWAKAHPDAAAPLGRADATITAMVKRLNARQADHSFLQLAAEANAPEEIERLHRIGYYGLIALGDGQAQPGAVLNGMWYLRNARIFAKVEQVARPGDRVLVIFGGGHAYWLRHFARETPGFQLVEPDSVLR